jgi:hypothetical protein
MSETRPTYLRRDKLTHKTHPRSSPGGARTHLQVGPELTREAKEQTEASAELSLRAPNCWSAALDCAPRQPLARDRLRAVTRLGPTPGAFCCCGCCTSLLGTAVPSTSSHPLTPVPGHQSTSPSTGSAEEKSLAASRMSTRPPHEARRVFAVSPSRSCTRAPRDGRCRWSGSAAQSRRRPNYSC